VDRPSLSRVKTPARIAAPLLVVLALVSLALTPLGSPASAKLAPTLTITAGDPDSPVRVALPTEDPDYAGVGYRVGVAGGPATNVTVTVSGTGLTTPPPKNLGNVATLGVGSAAVTATAGGFHQLTFTVTADGAAPAATTLNYVWAPTGALTVTPGASLRSTYFYTTGIYSENDSSFEDSSMLLFLTDTIAYYGTPDAGLPRCKTGSTTATSGCMSYAYDPVTHLIQVGGAIGTVGEQGVHTIGLGITDVQGGDYFAKRDWVDQLAFPRHPRTYARTWRWFSGNHCPGCATFAALTLRKNGTFVLADDWRKKRTISGRYVVNRSGRLTLTGKFGHEVHTFGLLVDKQGKPDPGLGVAFTFGKNKHAYYIFLEPRKK
jgi:hypothetical protein